MEFLSPTEALAEYADKIDKQLDQYRLFDHDSFKDFERRKGEVMHSSRLIHRLRQMEPRLIVQQQINFPGDWGLYIQHRDRLVFLTGLSKGWLTEFSYTLVDERNLPDDPKWGWRHVLVRLMSKGVLTWDGVVKEFGNPLNANSERWRMYTVPFREYGSRGTVHTSLKSHFD